MHRNRVPCLSFVALSLVSEPAGTIEFVRMTNCCPAPQTGWVLSSPALSPDGLQIAYCDEFIATQSTKPRSHLQFAIRDGERPRILLPLPTDGSLRAPAWSPDGQRLAIWVEDSDPLRAGIWVCERQQDMESGVPVRWVSDRLAAEPVWSPDGTSLAYTSSGELWVVSGPGVAPVRIATPGAVEAPTWATGALAYVYGDHIWMQYDTIQRQLTAGPWRDEAPALSADGEWVAFASNRSGNWDIWAVSSGGGTAVRITYDPADDRDPSWSAAGDALAFVSWRGGAANVWLATELPRLTVEQSPAAWTAVKQRFR